MSAKSRDKPFGYWEPLTKRRKVVSTDKNDDAEAFEPQETNNTTVTESNVEVNQDDEDLPPGLSLSNGFDFGSIEASKTVDETISLPKSNAFPGVSPNISATFAPKKITPTTTPTVTPTCSPIPANSNANQVQPPLYSTQQRPHQTAVRPYFPQHPYQQHNISARSTSAPTNHHPGINGTSAPIRPYPPNANDVLAKYRLVNNRGRGGVPPQRPPPNNHHPSSAGPSRGGFRGRGGFHARIPVNTHSPNKKHRDVEAWIQEMITIPSKWTAPGSITQAGLDGKNFDAKTPPRLPLDPNTIVSYVTRQKMLELFFGWFLQVSMKTKPLPIHCPNLPHVCALEKEAAIYNASANLSTYRSQWANFQTRAKKFLETLHDKTGLLSKIFRFLHDECPGVVPNPPQWPPRKPADSGEGSEAAPSGGAAATANVKLTYENVQKFILTEEQKEQYGYPMPRHLHPSKPKETPEWWTDGKTLAKCIRCKKEYQQYYDPKDMDPQGCTFHPGYLIHKQKSYACCQGPQGTSGCEVGYHVYEINDLDEITGFVETPPNKAAPIAICSLDCEMSYTSGGMELSRLSVIDVDGNPLIDELITPKYPVVDLNTRYSGVSSLEGSKHTLESIQKKFFELISPETILIGHSLNSDMKAFRLIHPTVVDTSQLFPHPRGLPIRFSLRVLSAKYLQRFIQQSNSRQGHDSIQDSLAALDLVRYKVGYDMGIRNFASGDAKLVAPVANPSLHGRKGESSSTSPAIKSEPSEDADVSTGESSSAAKSKSDESEASEREDPTTNQHSMATRRASSAVTFRSPSVQGATSLPNSPNLSRNTLNSSPETKPRAKEV